MSSTKTRLNFTDQKKSSLRPQSLSVGWKVRDYLAACPHKASSFQSKTFILAPAETEISHISSV
jgi:hypothetical protein